MSHVRSIACKIAAAFLNYRLEYAYTYEPLYPNGNHETPQVVASLQLVADFRGARSAGRAEAREWGHQLFVRNDPEAMRWVVELNKESLKVAGELLLKLADMNRDFFNALYHTATKDQQPDITIHEYGTGPFKDSDRKLKKEYVATSLTYDSF